MDNQITNKGFLRRIRTMARTFLARGGIHQLDLKKIEVEEKNHYDAVFISAFYRILTEMQVIDGATSLNLISMAFDVYSTNPTLRKAIAPAYLQFAGDNYYTREALISRLTEREADCFMRIFYINFVAENNQLLTREIRQKIEKFLFKILNLKP